MVVRETNDPEQEDDDGTPVLQLTYSRDRYTEYQIDLAGTVLALLHRSPIKAQVLYLTEPPRARPV